MISKLAFRPYYRRRPRLWREPLGILDKRSAVSHRWRYVYLRVPKAANSTVLRTLLSRCPEPGVDAADLELAKRQMTHLGGLKAADLGNSAGYFTFTVVREPYARVLSAYLDKFREGDKHLRRYGERVSAFDSGRVSFAGFCRYLNAGGEAENAHWMRQTRLTGLSDRLDIVGRVETLETDLTRILQRITGEAGSFPAPRDGPPATQAAQQVAETYDEETRAIVARIYAEDFAAFGYTP